MPVKLDKIDDVSEALAEIKDEAGLPGVEMDELVATMWRATRSYIENLSGGWPLEDPEKKNFCGDSEKT